MFAENKLIKDSDKSSNWCPHKLPCVWGQLNLSKKIIQIEFEDSDLVVTTDDEKRIKVTKKKMEKYKP